MRMGVGTEKEGGRRKRENLWAGKACLTNSNLIHLAESFSLMR
jgi:hypothetical protein